MRALALAILVLGTASIAEPAFAQTYSPLSPVCLKVYGRYAYIECGYTSLEQCAMTASGRQAECVIHPYFGKALEKSARRDRPQRRVY